VAGHLAGLGALFRNERRAISKTNLMVFLRPYIIRDSEAGRSMTLNRYDFMRRAQGGLQPERSWAMPACRRRSCRRRRRGAGPVPASGPRATIKAVPIEGARESDPQSEK
jgi:general secretion pathway protein D